MQYSHLLKDVGISNRDEQDFDHDKQDESDENNLFEEDV